MLLHKKKMHNGESFVSRIVVKFHDSAGINYRNGSDVIEILYRKEQWKAFIGLYPFIQIDNLFTSVSPDGIIELVNKARVLDATYNPPDLLSYYVFSFPASIRPKEVLLSLSAFREIEIAYLQSAAIDPPGASISQRPVYFRKHLDPAPTGIDAKYAWSIKGGKGSPGVKFIDIEQGWVLDNNVTNAKMLPLTGINNTDFGKHGAAVLGVIMMKDDGDEGGIAPGVSGYVISQWRVGGEPNDADAILAAITYLNFGDILLVETQSFYSASNSKVWPAEVHDATFQVIRLATALGVIVIEAAGNGHLYNRWGNDLDLFLSNKKRVLNPASRFFKDSGAIIVAAASMNVPHHRIRSSNYGKRINCYAWGEGVITAINYSTSPETAVHPYPTGFTGTSSASAIIAGVAIAVQSISETRYNMRLSPSQMRNILSSDKYGTASVNGRTRDKIGVMPDLKKIIDNCLRVPVNEPPQHKLENYQLTK